MENGRLDDEACKLGARQTAKAPYLKLRSPDASDGAPEPDKIFASHIDTGAGSDDSLPLGDEYAIIFPPAERGLARRARRSAEVLWAPMYSNEKPRPLGELLTAACQVGHSIGSGVVPTLRPPPTPPRDMRAGR